MIIEDFVHYCPVGYRGCGRFAAALQAIRTPGLHAVLVYRLGNWLTRRGLLLNILFLPVYVVLADFVRFAWGIEIGRGAVIGHRCAIVHAGCIVISDNAVIGDDCRIHQGVTIGGLGPGVDTAPQIGNGVFIGAGAKLIGDINIGDGARIGANAVVHKDIPPGATAVCSPGCRILPFEAKEDQGE